MELVKVRRRGLVVVSVRGCDLWLLLVICD